MINIFLRLSPSAPSNLIPSTLKAEKENVVEEEEKVSLAEEEEDTSIATVSN